MKTNTILTILALLLALFLGLSCGYSGDGTKTSSSDDDLAEDDDDSVDDDDDSDDDDATTADDDDSDDDDDATEESVWHDPTSNLNWQNGSDAGTLPMTFGDAVDYCENLYWSNEMNWRLPTISELRSLVRGCPATEPGGECGVTDECLSKEECYGDGSVCDGPGNGCPSWDEGYYLPESLTTVEPNMNYQTWSSSQVNDMESHVWWLNFAGANLRYGLAYEFSYVRCVY